MPRLSDNTAGPPPGKLVVSPVSQGCVDVEYVPALERLLQAGVPADQVSQFRARLLHLDVKQGMVTIFPINTNPSRDNFLKPKYDRVCRITIGGRALVRFVSCPATQEDVMAVLESLPSCFVKDFDYGLGFVVDHSSIVEAVETLSECSAICISDEHETHIDHASSTFYISIDDFRKSRRHVREILRAGQTTARVVNKSDTYNYFASRLGYPQVSAQMGLDPLQQRILNMTQGGHDQLSVNEQGAVMDMFAENAVTIARTHPKEFSDLRGDVEIIALTTLIERYEALLGKSSLEAEWQSFFAENPIILSLAFSHPVVLVQDRASVGGNKLTGSGQKIADFLYKNKMTNNAAIVEIKKPSAPLVRKKAYRDNVYGPSPELSGAISQALDQKSHFEQDIATLVRNSRASELESHSIGCCLVIGKMPDSEDRRKSFEQYRGNSKSVIVATFDEVLEKIKQIRELLRPNA